MFNPLKHRYLAHFIGEENQDIFLQLQHEQRAQIIRFPKALLPDGFDYQQGLQIGLFPPQMPQGSEEVVLKSVLQELLN